MRNSIQLILILLTISISSCRKQEAYVITGNLTGFPDSSVIYLRNLSTDETFDSTFIIAGKFQLTGQLQDEPEQIWLNTRVGGEFIYTNLLMGNEKVNIAGDIRDFPWDVTITGSKSQDDANCLNELTKNFDRRRDSLVQSFFRLSGEEQEEKGKEIWDEIKSIDDTTFALRVSYVKEHINTYPGIIHLGYLKNALPKDTVQNLYGKLSDELRSSKYAKVVEVYLNEKISEIGDAYHDFTALNKDGDTLRLSDITGKYILLDFTAANCGPCVQSAEELRLIDQTYSDSLQIVSFSADSKKEMWLNSLKRDSVTWISVWDGEGQYSKTFIKYGVRGFPTFFLIHPDGRIMDIWSGYGKGTLESKLERFRNT